MKIDKILYILIITTCGIIIGTGVDYFKLKISDPSIYIKYDSILSDKEEYKIGEDIFFTSTLYRGKPQYMKYHDIFRCDSGDGTTWFSSTNTVSKNVNKVGSVVSRWRYQGDLPQEPTICFLDSYPSVLLNYGIMKTQNVKSNVFRIVE